MQAVATVDSGPVPRVQQSAETVRLYASDWAAFAQWCRQAGEVALPATPETVGAYLASVSSLSPGALARHLAAIADRHRRHGLISPAADSSVRAQLRAAQAERAPVVRAVMWTAAQLDQMARGCPADLAGERDRALLLLAAGCGEPRLPHAALVRLDVEHLRVSERGLELGMPQAAGLGGRRVVAASTLPQSCAVRAMETWLRVSGTRYGPVFRKVDRWGNLEHRRLSPDAVSRIINRRWAPLASHAADDPAG